MNPDLKPALAAFLDHCDRIRARERHGPTLATKLRIARELELNKLTRASTNFAVTGQRRYEQDALLAAYHAEEYAILTLEYIPHETTAKTK
jgi:hypothetical protein